VLCSLVQWLKHQAYANQRCSRPFPDGPRPIWWHTVGIRVRCGTGMPTRSDVGRFTYVAAVSWTARASGICSRRRCISLPAPWLQWGRSFQRRRRGSRSWAPPYGRPVQGRSLAHTVKHQESYRLISSSGHNEDQQRQGTQVLIWRKSRGIELWTYIGKCATGQSEALQTNRKFDVTWPNYILDLEILHVTRTRWIKDSRWEIKYLFFFLNERIKVTKALPWTELGNRAFGQCAQTAMEDIALINAIYIHISHTEKFSKQPKLASINSLSLHGETIWQDFTFLAASFEWSSLFAPVQTIFPEANTNAVVFGSLILMITAAKRCQVSRLRWDVLQLINECDI